MAWGPNWLREGGDTKSGVSVAAGPIETITLVGITTLWLVAAALSPSCGHDWWDREVKKDEPRNVRPIKDNEGRFFIYDAPEANQ
jgi:hypothetical protein